MPNLRKIFCFVFSAIVCFCFNKVHAQRNLTREEIFERWTKEKGVLHLTEKEGLDKFVDVDSLLQIKIFAELNRLEQANVDTLGLFIASYPGYYFYSNRHPSCYSSYPIDVYLFWRSQGIFYVQKNKSKCEDAFKANDSLKNIFDFYADNFKKIDSEYIMPVIFNGIIDSAGGFGYSSEIIDHEPNYFIFCKLGKHVKFLSFTESYYTNKKSLFHRYNLRSKTYHWFTIIKSLLLH